MIPIGHSRDIETLNAEKGPQALLRTCTYQMTGYIHIGRRLHSYIRAVFGCCRISIPWEIFFLVGSSFNVEAAASRLRLKKVRPSASTLLMCLPSNTTRRPGLDRSLLLQTASSTRRFRLRGKLLQSFHRDTILQGRLVRGMEENPTSFRQKLPKSAFSLCS